jgi:hypothetical protein
MQFVGIVKCEDGFSVGLEIRVGAGEIAASIDRAFQTVDPGVIGLGAGAVSVVIRLPGVYASAPK